MIGKLQAGLTVESWGKTPEATRQQGVQVFRCLGQHTSCPTIHQWLVKKRLAGIYSPSFPSSFSSSLADFPIFNPIHQNGRRADVSDYSPPMFHFPPSMLSSYGLLLATPLCLAVKLINLLQFHCHQARWCPGMKSRLSTPIFPTNQGFYRQLSRTN